MCWVNRYSCAVLHPSLVSIEIAFVTRANQATDEAALKVVSIEVLRQYA